MLYDLNLHKQEAHRPLQSIEYQRLCTDFPKNHEVYNFVIPFLDHDQFIPSLSEMCLAEEKRIFKEIKHLQYDLKILTQ